jgi:hypothetical protein
MNATSHKSGLFSNLLVVALLSCCATFILSSCSKKPSDAIIGKWQPQGSKEPVEFRKDGTLVNPQNPNQNGKYTFTDGSHMNLQINTGNTNKPTMSMTCEVRINGNKMDWTMTGPDLSQQQKTHFTRLK